MSMSAVKWTALPVLQTGMVPALPSSVAYLPLEICWHDETLASSCDAVGPAWTDAVLAVFASDAPGTFHCWFAPPPQSQIWSLVPLAELLPVTSRHRPDPEFTSCLAEFAVHCCAPEPLQS